MAVHDGGGVEAAMPVGGVLGAAPEGELGVAQQARRLAPERDVVDRDGGQGGSEGGVPGGGAARAEGVVVEEEEERGGGDRAARAELGAVLLDGLRRVEAQVGSAGGPFEPRSTPPWGRRRADFLLHMSRVARAD
ncbi:hypothetical protein ACFP3U_16140 [Kitasatospora misakiensis]|uniref:Uncharacterized protein n=1 Tax=Kitasatospora misakiensis TaxID=67330 RepID=A0ABW0X5R6_9ACTN